MALDQDCHISEKCKLAPAALQAGRYHAQRAAHQLTTQKRQKQPY